MAQPAAEASTKHWLLDHEGLWTEEEYLALPEDNRRIELLDGSLLVSPHAGRRHQRASFRLAKALDAVAPAGFEVFETINVRVGPGRILIPDLVVLVDSDLSDLDDLDDAVIDGAHVAMAVEIVSRGSVAADRAIKPPLYAAAGVRRCLRVEFAARGVSAVAYVLRDGRFVEDGRAGVGECLAFQEPFPVEIDLSTLVGKPSA